MTQLSKHPSSPGFVRMHMSGTNDIGTRCLDEVGRLLFTGAFPAMQEFSLGESDTSGFA